MSSKIIAFVNDASGGGLGEKVKEKIADIKDLYIVNLPNDPYSWKSLDKKTLFDPNTKIIVCGGDGTINWVVSMLMEYYESNKINSRPPIAVLPLGTGNDLSNMLGWGDSFDSINLFFFQSRFNSIVEGNHTIKNLDVWRVTIYEGEDKKTEKTMLNYFSIGVDANIAKNFSDAREKMPSLFVSHIASKMMYVPISLATNDGNLLKDFLEGHYIDQDDQQINFVFDESSKTFVCQAITKIYGGADLWKSNNRAVDDGLFEVIQTGGVFHLGLNHIGIKASDNIDNAKTAFLKAKKSVFYQIDGEPFVSDGPARFLIEKIGSYPMMFAKN